jgi:hypothetical protein
LIRLPRVLSIDRLDREALRLRPVTRAPATEVMRDE